MSDSQLNHEAAEASEDLRIRHIHELFDGFGDFLIQKVAKDTQDVSISAALLTIASVLYDRQFADSLLTDDQTASNFEDILEDYLAHIPPIDVNAMSPEQLLRTLSSPDTVKPLHKGGKLWLHSLSLGRYIYNWKLSKKTSSSALRRLLLLVGFTPEVLSVTNQTEFCRRRYWTRTLGKES